MKHALLSPSAASRWLACTKSARLELDVPSTSSSYADEGTLAHTISEYMLYLKRDKISQAAYDMQMIECSKNQHYDSEMISHAESYVDYIIEQQSEAIERSKFVEIHQEVKLDLRKYIPEGFGTSDVVIIADKYMYVIDLKYGKGVPVDAFENKQMMIYALGAYEEFKMLYDIETVKMIIYQPRLDAISDYEIQIDELIAWGEDVLHPRAVMAFNGEGEIIAGEHCRFCKIRATCRVNADFNLEIMRHEFKESTLLTDEEMTEILQKRLAFKNWIEHVEKYALEQSVRHGKKWPGMKLVEGISKRKYIADAFEPVVENLKKEKFSFSDIVETKLLPIGKLTKVIGKKVFEKIVSPFIIKPQGKLTLVPLEDKRVEVNSFEMAVQDFEDEDLID